MIFVFLWTNNSVLYLLNSAFASIKSKKNNPFIELAVLATSVPTDFSCICDGLSH